MVVFCSATILITIPMSLNCCFKLFGVVRNAPTTTGVTSSSYCSGYFPRDMEILDWCPAGPVQGEGASLALIGHPSSDVVTIKMLYGVDILHRPALHPIFSYQVG